MLSALALLLAGGCLDPLTYIRLNNCEVYLERDLKPWGSDNVKGPGDDHTEIYDNLTKRPLVFTVEAVISGGGNIDSQYSLIYQWYKASSRQTNGSFAGYPEGYAVNSVTGSITAPQGTAVQGATAATFDPRDWSVGYDSSLLPVAEQPSKAFNAAWYYYCEIKAVNYSKTGDIVYISEPVYSKAVKAQVKLSQVTFSKEKEDAGEASVNYTVWGVNGAAFKVYNTQEGGQALSNVNASGSTATLTLSAVSGYLAPKTYYVSITGAGGQAIQRIPLTVLPTPNTSPQSLASRFFLSEPTNADGVSAVFTAVHDYLAAVPVDDWELQLGDWVDLPSLNVDPYGDYSQQGTSFTSAQRGLVNITSNIALAEGTLLRIIIVGKDSFHSGGTYLETDNNRTPHLVFQFQNLPGRHRMDIPSDSNTYVNGYSGAEMRKYLSPVYGIDGSGTFFNGLLAAGIPESLFFAPIRYVSGPADLSGNTIAQIADKLWLPTEYEISGESGNSVQEFPAQQARLEYYITLARRKKYTGANAAGTWFRASPFVTNSSLAQAPAAFCATGTSGAWASLSGGEASWVAPAFCIK
jgi:hypothetical protein